MGQENFSQSRPGTVHEVHKENAKIRKSLCPDAPGVFVSLPVEAGLREAGARPGHELLRVGARPGPAPVLVERERDLLRERQLERHKADLLVIDRGVDQLLRVHLSPSL